MTGIGIKRDGALNGAPCFPYLPHGQKTLIRTCERSPPRAHAATSGKDDRPQRRARTGPRAASPGDGFVDGLTMATLQRRR